MSIYIGGNEDWTSGINNINADYEEIASDILNKFLNGWGQIDEVRNSHVKWLRSFYGIPDGLPAYKSGTGASNMHVPLIEPLTDTIVAKYFLTLLSYNPFIRWETDSNDPQDILATRVLERVIKYLICDRIPGARDQLYLWIQDAVLYGQGFVHVYFDTVTHNTNSIQTIYNPLNPNIPLFDATNKPIQSEVVETIIDYTGLKFEIIDINNIVIDWSTMDWRKAPVIVRERIDPEVYLERVNNSGYLALSDEEMNGLLVGDSDWDDIQVEVDNKSGTTIGSEDNLGRKKIELYHYYGKGYVPYFDKDGKIVDKIRQDCKCIIAGRRLRDGNKAMILPPIPFGVKPIAMLRFKPKRGEALGRGVGAQIYDLQGELNVTRNQRLDAINFNLNQGFIISPGAVEDESELNSRNGQVIHLSDSQGTISAIPRASIPPETWRHEAEIKMDAELVTSSADILRGQMERQETAFTTNLRNNNAGQRLESIVFRMADGFRELAEIMKGLLAEFTPSNNPVIVKLTEEEYQKYAEELGQIVDNNGVIKVTPDILKRTMYAIPAISALDGDNRAKSQELLQLMQIMQPFMQINPQTGYPIGWKDRSGNTNIPDIGYVIREYARLNKFDELRNMITVIPAEAEKARQEQIFQQQQAIAASKAGEKGSLPTQPKISSPSELAGQSMLTSPKEQLSQQAGIEDMLANV